MRRKEKIAPRAELGGDIRNCQSDKNPPSTNSDDGSDLLLPELLLLFLKPSLALEWFVLRLPPAIGELPPPPEQNDGVCVEDLCRVGYKSIPELRSKETATAKPCGGVDSVDG